MAETRPVPYNAVREFKLMQKKLHGEPPREHGETPDLDTWPGLGAGRALAAWRRGGGGFHPGADGEGREATGARQNSLPGVAPNQEQTWNP